VTGEPEHFGPYRVLGVLGNGGMGRVLRAHDDEHERDVALKVLHPQWAQDESYRSRFRREAQIAARLNEPHVIPIHRYGEIEGQLFLDMRLVEGENLDSLLRRGGPLVPARAVDLVSQIANALDAAHAGGLVHRDVKPSNVLLAPRMDGADLTSSVAGEDFAYLADFGIARVASEGDGPALTATGTAVGSTEYMAPERFGPTVPDARSDVYSLACVLYELLTGHRPFGGGDPLALMYAHLHEQPRPPSQVRPSVPRGLDDVVLRGMAKDPAQRWQTAGQLAAAARAALALSGVPVPSSDAPTSIGPAGAGERAPTRPEQQAPPPAPPVTVLGPVPPPTPMPAPMPAPARRPRWVSAAPWIVAGTALLALVLLTVLLVVIDRRADDAVDGAADAARRLVEIGLPSELDEDRCTEATPGEGELFVLSCPAADQPDGFPTTTFTVYPGDGAEAELTASVEGTGLAELEDVYACGSDPTPEGWARLVDYDGAEAGRLSCFVDGDGDPQLHWYWADLGMLGVAEIRGGGIEALANLRSWWTDYADRDLV
jgi:serine/threonine-protein kinase